MAETIPLSLYVHFPWCVRKCPYCDFNSHAVRGEVPEDDYVDALLRDLDFELQQSERRPLVSMFFGGGTPSLFSDRSIGRVLEGVSKRLAVAPGAEITLEANPGTADAGHFRGYRQAGINRLSIGVQSLNADHLKALGRIHDPEGAIGAYRLARQAGFDNINLDLMYALPGQTGPGALEDLRQLLVLAPDHVSYYQLTLEPNTEFAAHPPPLPNDDAAWAMQEQGQAELARQGYEQYEVSAYAGPSRRSRHNLNYWEFGDYLGIGAGAHGKRSVADRVMRRSRQRHPKTYLQAVGTTGAIQEEREVSRGELPFEFCMNALRLNAGFDLADFTARTGLAPTVIAAPLRRARERGLIEQREGRVAATALGRAHLNAVLRLLLPE